MSLPTITENKRRSLVTRTTDFSRTSTLPSDLPYVAEGFDLSPERQRPFQVVLLDSRVLVRESFIKSLALIGPQLDLKGFSGLEEWEAAGLDTEGVSVILVHTAWLRLQTVSIFTQLERISVPRSLISVVIVADDEDLDAFLAAIKGGARGYIPTSANLKLAVKIIELVAAGGLYLPPDMLSLLGRSAERGSHATRKIRPMDQFTARQMAVVEELRRGKSNKMIAHELNLRESTVKIHIHNIMRKLRVHNRTEAAYILNQMTTEG